MEQYKNGSSNVSTAQIETLRDVTKKIEGIHTQLETQIQTILPSQQKLFQECCAKLDEFKQNVLSPKPKGTNP